MTSPFPGESLAATSSGNVTGAAILPGTVTYRADSGMFFPGDESWVDVPLSPLLLEAGDAGSVVVSWVVEVLAGSGELVLTEDAGSLGTHAVSPGTLVVASSLSGADVVAGGTARLTISCTAGPVQVQQVKLRVWPVGGPLGGFSDPYTPPPVPIRVSMRRVAPDTYAMTDYVYAGTKDLAFAATEEHLGGALAAFTVGDPVFVDPQQIAATFGATADDAGPSGSGRGSGYIGMGVAYVEPYGDPTVPDPTGTFGVDWIYPPGEVPYDPDGWQWAGAPVWGWFQGIATITVDYDPDGPTPGDFRIAAEPRDAVDPPATEFSDIVTTANVIAGIAATPILPTLEFDLPTVGPTGMLRLAVWHQAAEPNDYEPFTQSGTTPTGSFISTGDTKAVIDLGRYVDGVFQPAYVSHTRPYRYWTPSGTVTHKLRQYHRDDGLGIAPRRAYGGASRNKTRRAFGYT